MNQADESGQEMNQGEHKAPETANEAHKTAYELHSERTAHKVPQTGHDMDHSEYRVEPCGQEIDRAGHKSHNAGNKVDLTPFKGEESGQETDKPENSTGRIGHDIQITQYISSGQEEGEGGLHLSELHNNLLILSSAGKPVYSLVGDEERVAGLCGVIQALLAVAGRGGDSLTSVRAGSARVVFLTRGPLILLAMCRADSPESLLRLQLTWTLEQVVSVLTLTQLNSVLERRRNYDLRRLLGGAERLVGVAASRASDPAAVLGGVRALALALGAREAAGAALAAALAPLPHAVFALLVADDAVVATARRRKYTLRPPDLLVLLNLVRATHSFRAAETWTPVCLPHFDTTGFLHAHVSYVSARSCLLLLSVQRDAFFSLSEARRHIADSLLASGTLDAVDAAAAAPLQPLPLLGAEELLQFAYKCRETDCVVSSHALWCGERARELARCTRATKLLYTRTRTHTLLAWVTSGFEVYAWLSTWPDKAACIVAVDRLLRWIRREHDTLLLPQPHTF